MRYIFDDTSRFKTFDTNRLTIIHEGSVHSQWKYIPSKLNPADMSSRGICARNFVKNKDWIFGPAFLKCTDRHWPNFHWGKNSRW